MTRNSSFTMLGFSTVKLGDYFGFSSKKASQAHG
jgi:hypothetical protein